MAVVDQRAITVGCSVFTIKKQGMYVSALNTFIGRWRFMERYDDDDDDDVLSRLPY